MEFQIKVDESCERALDKEKVRNLYDQFLFFYLKYKNLLLFILCVGLWVFCFVFLFFSFFVVDKKLKEFINFTVYYCAAYWYGNK